VNAVVVLSVLAVECAHRAFNEERILNGRVKRTAVQFGIG
jgi:hypothetical protein